jgi:peptidoglycan/LPS O-acetylase OafA/YrhL
MRYSPALDGLRAMSVFAVMALHGSYGHFGGGWVGVDVFFALSGFLITRILLGDYAREGSIRFASFYVRRARRLLPALWLALGLARVLWSATDSTVRYFPPALATMFYYANWRFAFLGASGMGALAHTWSLSVEEQFYFIWPPIVALFLARRPSLRLATIATGVLVMFSTTLRVVLYREASPLAAYSSTLTHIDVILVGALAAMAQAQAQKTGGWAFWRGRIGTATAWLAIATLARLSMTLPSDSRWLYDLGGFTLLGVLAIAVVLHLVNAPEGRLASILGGKVFANVGRRSYGIYLYHFPIFLALERLRVAHSQLNFVGVLSLRIAITLIFAWASYDFYERRFLDRRSLRSRPAVQSRVSETMTSARAVATVGDTSVPIENGDALRDGPAVEVE